MPQSVSAYFYRVTLNDTDKGLSANIVQSLEVVHEVTLLLDIDAFCHGDWEPNDPKVYDTLSHLHDFKNQVFFNLLTEETLRRFE